MRKTLKPTKTKNYYISGLIILCLGLTGLVIDVIQWNLLIHSLDFMLPDVILISGLILSGLVTLFAGKASFLVGGLLVLLTWFVWNNGLSFSGLTFLQHSGSGDQLYRVGLPILAGFFIVSGIAILAYRRK